MFSSTICNVDISIQLNAGLYRFSGSSAIGKTRLFNYLKLLSEYENSILAITYKKDLDKDVIINHDYWVVMFDRFDLYSDFMTDNELLALGNKSIVLMDYKGYTADHNVELKLCNLAMSKNKIEVYV